jgi:hypothetical protein
VPLPVPNVELKQLTVELIPLPSYPFTAGITAIRGSLYEKNVPLGQTPVAIPRATIRLEWKDSGNTYQPGTATAVTNAAGDFISILRLTPDEEPYLDKGTLAVRLYAKRSGGVEKSQDLIPPQGRVMDATFAWDQLQ